MKQTRRRVIQSSIAITLGSTLAGCLGGGGGNESEGNNSTSTTGTANQSTTNKSSNESRNTTANTSSTNSTNATAGQSVAVLGAEPEFREQEMSINLEGETSVDRVSLQTPKGDEFASYEPSEYEAATFTLIRSSSSQFGYKRYPFGEWTATAFRNDSKIDERSYELEPSFSVSGVEARSGEVQVTFENIGTAPAPITAARVYNATRNPGPDQFGGGFVDSSSITSPGSTITIETRLLGFGDQFPIKENRSASDYEGEYCTGTSYLVTISHRIFSEIRETTGSLIFGGGPVEGQQGSAACSEYTLNTGTNVSLGNATANGTGANATNGTAGNTTNATGANATKQTVTFTTTGNQSSKSNSTTTAGETSTNESGS